MKSTRLVKTWKSLGLVGTSPSSGSVEELSSLSDVMEDVDPFIREHNGGM